MTDDHDTVAGMSAITRWKARAWWATVTIVCVAMASFIVFEVLDVDGSNLSRGSSGNTLSADPPTLETERLLSVKGDVCSAPNTERLSTPLSPRLNLTIARSSLTPAAFRAHVRIIRREAAKDNLKRTFSPSPADPA